MAYVSMVIAGGNTKTLSFSRVPIVGELVNFETINYRVTDVQHTPIFGATEGSLALPLAIIVVDPEP
ncbi:hypothetical protein BE04_12785 [Sorangium cellulosum]|uniref:Uncharacterized protein n=2 Tax=Sorangium cellulosum TaxID=56 RepID=A0A150PV03_SORCE|nr:hypothetical protein [Sorangium cellulosum]AGP40946.1 hypothetical protein SCE1572_44520 [Sorangium cellulosum So0157-2]KYF59520.1 hypothetical protein BE04_12785 [Sorangium cellulosum]